MTLWIDQGSDYELTAYVVRDLKKICPDPNLAFDVGYAVNNRIPSGEVTYSQVAVDTLGCRTIHGMVKSKTPVVLKPRNPGHIVQIAGELRKLNEYTAFTYWPNLPSTSPPPTSITVVYDPTDDARRGYWVQDIDGNKIAEPPDVILMHEFGHVEQALTSTVDMDSFETYPISKENAYRQEIGLPMRYGYEGGTGLRAIKSGGTTGDCFIATAAYGSEINPNVERLRSFRDDILRQTRSGRAFFDEYWRYYYRLSPEIVRMMGEDDNLRELVRWSLVAPIVGFLKLAMEYPEAPTDDLPEAWRTYIETMRSEFETWSKHIEPPREFADMPAEEAAEEIRIALAYLFWRRQDRAQYLAELVERGSLPLLADDAQRVRIEEMLRRDGRDAAEIESILGALDGPST